MVFEMRKDNAYKLFTDQAFKQEIKYLTKVKDIHQKKEKIAKTTERMVREKQQIENEK